MKHYFFTKETYTKQKAFSLACENISDFCELNNLQKPKVNIFRSEPFARHGGMTTYGFYEPFRKVLNVNLEKSSIPVFGLPVRRWSYPGYKADRTVSGVLYHEFGHYVHYIHKAGIRYVIEYFKAMDTERPITSYEPNVGERIAETMRLFMANPNLLKCGRPKRYEMIKAIFNFKPLHDEPWEGLLVKAHPRFIEVARNWIIKR